MTSPKQTDEESLKLLQTLHEEKRKSKELEEELQVLRSQFITLRNIAQQSKDETTRLKAELQHVSHMQPEDLEELNLQKQRIDKLMGLLQEREKRIADLQQFEMGNKKAAEVLIEKNKIIQQLEEEKEKLLSNQEEIKNHSEQLERVIKHLRERSEEANLEVNQLQQESEASLSNLEALQKELKDKDSALFKLTKRLGDIENEKIDAQDELKAIESQQTLLKNRLIALQVDLKKRETTVQDLNQLLETLRNEKSTLDAELQAKNQKLKACEDELGELRQDWESLNSNYKDALNANTSLKERFIQQQEEINSQKTELGNHKQTIEELEKEKKLANELHLQLQIIQTENVQLNEKIKELSQEMVSLKEQTAQLQQDLEDCQLEKRHHQELAQQKELNNQELTLQVEELKKAKTHLEEVQVSQTLALEEKNEKLHTAHHHLAKKVKESTLLAEKIDEQNTRMQELEQSLSQTLNRLSEVENKFNQSKEQEKHLQNQLQELIKANESLQLKWEEKYFAMYDKWQNTENANSELKKIEAKYQQLKGFLGNLNHFVDSLHGTDNTAMPSIPKEKEKEREATVPPAVAFGDALPEDFVVMPQATSPQDLFSLPKTAPKAKASFFD